MLAGCTVTLTYVQRVFPNISTCSTVTPNSVDTFAGHPHSFSLTTPGGSNRKDQPGRVFSFACETPQATVQWAQHLRFAQGVAYSHNCQFR